MTERKSVVSINVDDAEWKKFAESFAKFSKALGESKEDLSDLADETETLEKAQKKQAAAKKKQDDDAAKSAKAKRKEEEEAYKAQRKKFAEAASERDRIKKQHAEDLRSLKESAKWTADIARNVASTAWGLAKWAALGAIGGGFGLGGLASSAADARRQSMRLGVNTGELRSANVNFGKYIDAEGALGNLANARDDNRLNWIFSRLGMGDPHGRSTGDLLAESLPKLVAAFKQSGGNKAFAESTGLTQILPFEDIRQLSQLTEKELRETIASYQKDRQSLNVDDATSRAWQDFLASMKRAGQGIEVSLIRGLEKLTPYLTEFANGISKAIDAFVNSGRLQQWIKAVGEGLERLGAYLGSEEFKDDIQAFLDGLHSLATTFRHLFPKNADIQQYAKPQPGEKVGVSKWQATKDVYGALWAHLTGKDKAGRVSALESQYKLPAGLLDSVWLKESGRGVHNGLSSAGAGGDFQFMPGVAASYGIKDRWDFNQSSDAAARMLRDLLAHYAGDQQKALAAYNWGQGNLDRDIAAHGSDWGRYAPAETQRYAGVKVTIQNNTGGSAQATVAAMQ